MRTKIRLALPVLLIAVGFLSVVAAKDAPALVHPGMDGISPPTAKANSQIMPFYPATARMTKASGRVVVAASVLKNGKVGELEVVASDNPNQGFEDAALDAIKYWKFKPARDTEGEAVDSYTLIRLHFAPPYGPNRDGYVTGDSLINPTVPLGLAGAPAPRPGTTPGLGTASAEFRPNPIKAIKPNCQPGTKCMYDRREIEQALLEQRGEPGPIHPMQQRNRAPGNIGGR